MGSTVLLSSSACSAARPTASWAARSSAAARRWAASTAPLVAGWASLRGIRELRRYPLGTSTAVPFSPSASTSLSRIASGIALALLAIAAVPATAPTALGALLAGIADVGQQRDLSRPLDRLGELVLVATAGTADPAGADLAALGHEAAQGRDVLVVDLLDLVLAVRAGLAPAGTGAALLVAPPCGLGSACFGHVVESL